MKYDSGEDYGDGKKVYRDCVLVNKKYFSINENYPDEIIDINNPPKGYFVCDKIIAPIVCRLNAKGYETLFSCQGHIDHTEGYDRPSLNLPYVMFKVGKHFDRYYKYLFKLPKQFEVEISSDIDDVEEAMKETYIYHNIDKMEDKRITIRSNAIYSYTDQYGDNKLTEEVFNKFNNIDIIDLMDWVEQLPDLTIEFSKCLYSERIIDRDTAQQVGFDFESAEEFCKDVQKAYILAAQNIDALKSSLEVIKYHINYLDKSYSKLNGRLANLKFVGSYKEDVKDDEGFETVEDIDRTSMYDSCMTTEKLKTRFSVTGCHNEDDFIKNLDIYKELEKIKKEKSEEE